MFLETMAGVGVGNTNFVSPRAKDFHSKQPLVAQMPAGVTCIGIIGNATNACVVQCRNLVGPFGSSVVVHTAGQANKRRFVVRGTNESMGMSA